MGIKTLTFKTIDELSERVSEMLVLGWLLGFWQMHSVHISHPNMTHINMIELYHISFYIEDGSIK